MPLINIKENFFLGAESKLYQTRRQMGLSRKKLSELSGVSAHSIERYEKGLSNATIDNIVKISQALDMDPRDLFELSNGAFDFFYSDELEAIKKLSDKKIADLCGSEFYEELRELTHSRDWIAHKDSGLFKDVNDHLTLILRSLSILLQTIGDKNNYKKPYSISYLNSVFSEIVVNSKDLLNLAENRVLG